MNQIINQKPAVVIREMLKRKRARINGLLWHINDNGDMLDENGHVVDVTISDFIRACWDLKDTEIAELISEEGMR